jgi:hypothetical protein
MTKEQAALLVDAHEVDRLMDDEEEREMLRDNNPELLDAYIALLEMAKGT